MSTRFSIEYLDELAVKRIRQYFSELVTSDDDILSEDDLLGAVQQAQQIFLDNTSWSVSDCIDRAISLADPIKFDLMKNQQPCTYGVGWPD